MKRANAITRSATTRGSRHSSRVSLCAVAQVPAPLKPFVCAQPTADHLSSRPPNNSPRLIRRRSSTLGLQALVQSP